MMWDLETPALLLYRDVMERNLTQMATRSRRLGVSLRPHIKTHKCLELGRRQLAQGARGITVSTLFEAQAFVRGGFTDLTWARSEEHTSELQSRPHLVCRLLLEKKKKKEK